MGVIDEAPHDDDLDDETSRATRARKATTTARNTATRGIDARRRTRSATASKNENGRSVAGQPPNPPRTVQRTNNRSTLTKDRDSSTPE
jgi:hypothetical protein